MSTIRSFLAISLIACASLASAQTSGTLSTQTSSNYSTAPWVITSGPGTYPDGGGVATFNEQINTILGTVPVVPIITVDVSVVLSGIVFNSVFQYQISGAAGNLNLSTTGPNTLNVTASNISSPSAFAAGHVIAAPIGGGGAFGLTKTGGGIVSLTGTNTYTGGTNINGGTLRISSGDAALGATGAGNDVSINNAVLRVSTAVFTTARNFSLSGSADIELFANATINGIISGSGTFTHLIGSTLTLTGANTYTGTIRNGISLLTVSGANGTIATAGAYDLAGTLTLDNATANNNNRISDTSAITSRGATIAVTGNSTAATSENAGALNLTNGNSTITVTPNAAQSAALNLASINRANNSTLFVRGTNLGAAAGAGVAQITSTAAPATLVGGGGAAGSTTISILPWAVGNVGAAATLGSSLVTYGATGLRPLAAAEYASAFGGNATDNVRLTAATAAPSGTTANAVVFAPSAAATLSGGPINITSGAFLYSPTATATGTVSAGLSFGAAEGIIATSNTLGVSGVISGSNGLTINPFNASTVTLSGANTYTGTTTLNGGTTAFGGTVANGGAGVFGASTSAIVMNVGTVTTRLYGNVAGTTLNRDLIVTGNTNQGVSAGLGTVGVTDFTMNGNIDMQRRLSIDGGGTAATPFTINGNISGAGTLTDAFSTFVVLNGNNTYSGGTDINTGTYLVGSDTAFGTGTIFFTGAGKIQSKDSTAHTIGNNITLLTTPTFQGTAALNFTGNLNLNGNAQGTQNIAVTNTAATTFSGLVSNGSVTKTGTGVLAFTRSAGNSYTGGTVLGNGAGTLNLNNSSGSATGPGTVSIGGTTAANRSTLSGSFRIAGNTQDTGVLSPGNGAALNGINDIGTANFDASLTLAANTLVNLEIANTVSIDRVNVGGILAFGGSSFVITTIGGFVAQLGNTFDLVDWGSANGTATVDVSGAATAPGTTWDTSNFTTNGTITVVVPEPSSWAMILSGSGLLVTAMRFRRRRQ